MGAVVQNAPYSLTESGRAQKRPQMVKIDWPTALKLPSGYVGKMVSVAIFYFAFCTVSVLALPDGQKLWAVGAGLVGLLVVMGILHLFSTKNPILTALDGSTAVAYLKTDMAAKDPKIIEGSATPVEKPQEQVALPGGRQ